MNTLSKLMRSVSLLLMGGMLWIPTAVSAQGPEDLVGRWEGSIDAGPQGSLPVAFVITFDGETLSTTMYSINQGNQAIPTSETTIVDGTLSITVAVIPGGGGFSGTINEDGAFVGTWSQGGASLPLTLTRTQAGGEVPAAAPLQMKCPGSMGAWSH